MTLWFPTWQRDLDQATICHLCSSVTRCANRCVYDSFMHIWIFLTLTAVSFIPADILCNVFFKKCTFWLLYCTVAVQMEVKLPCVKDAGLCVFFFPLSPLR